MWCYQKPRFEALLLSELQKQQQCTQFCDTLLMAGGVSVPTHSCVLSAISPHLSSALSSTPLPPAGQTRFLEFHTLSASTLLHMVRLLYSGEMAGEGEKEKQEAISAAAKLGIHGLVEVTKRNHYSRGEEDEEGQHIEVGAQIEPLVPQECEGKLKRWKRMVKDGCTILGKKKLSEGENDKCVQTEEVRVKTATPYYPPASSTVDVTALQCLEQTDSHLVPPHSPYIQMSVIYPTDRSEVPHHASAPEASTLDFTATGHTPVAVSAPPDSSMLSSFLPFSTQSTYFVAEPQAWCTGPEGADRGGLAAEEQEDERLEQFQGNIPGFINYFLNPNMEEGSCRGKPGRRRRTNVGVARRAGRGERRMRRPRARSIGRGRGGLMQTVDVQDVGMSKLQKLFLQRGKVRTSRLGQGGGAVGRKLYLKTREVLNAPKTSQRRRRGKIWEFSQNGDGLPFNEQVKTGGNKMCGRKATVQQLNQDSPAVGKPRRVRAKPPKSLSSSSHTVQFFQHSPCLSLLSPALSNKCPASPLLHTTSLPPASPPPNQDQPEQIESLLKEVRMGLDILTNDKIAPHSSLPTKSRSCAFMFSGNNLPKSKEVQSNDLIEAQSNFHGSPQFVIVANSEVPNLQQQGEGELNKIHNPFLQMFEQQLTSCIAGEEEVMGSHSSTKNPKRPQAVRCFPTTEWQQSEEAATKQRCSQRKKAGAPPAVSPKHNEGGSQKARTTTRRSKKRKTSHHVFSVEKKRKPTEQKSRINPDESKQLQQRPVVKLVRSSLLPVRFKLQGSCQNAKVKDSFLEETCQYKRQQVARRCRSKKNCQLCNNNESLVPQIQTLSFEPCGKEEQQSNYKTLEEKPFVQPQESTEGPKWRRKRRRSYSVKKKNIDAAEVKRVCFGQVSQLKTPTHITSSKSTVCVSEAATADAEDAINVKTASLISAGDGRQSEEDNVKLVQNVTIKETKEKLMKFEIEDGSYEIIDVESNSDEITDLDRISDSGREEEEKGCCQFRAPAVSPSLPSAKGASLESTGSEEDKDIDIIGGSCPLPDPVIISWRASSEGEEEDEVKSHSNRNTKNEVTTSLLVINLWINLLHTRTKHLGCATSQSAALRRASAVREVFLIVAPHLSIVSWLLGYTSSRSLGSSD